MAESILSRAIKRHGVQAVLAELTPDQIQYLQYEWEAWARPEQLPPDGEWLIWMVLAGRGFGKTRLAAEWVRGYAQRNPGCRIAIIGRTAGDVRTTMLEGPSGILAISPPWFMPVHEPSKMKVTWPNGSVALHFSAEEPKGLRGPQFHAAWCDELASWPMLGSEADATQGVPFAWTMLEFGMRLPDARPQVVVTTTPRPVRVIKDLMKDPDTVITKGSMFDNAANLSPEYVERMRRKWEGTRLGRQELYAEILDDVPGALWTRKTIEDNRREKPNEFQRIVIAVDPSGGHGEENDAQGIMAVGIGVDGHGYVLKDYTCRMSPDGWGRRAVQAYVDYEADCIVYENNFGGEMCEHVIQTAARAMRLNIATKAVKASRGKMIRAEPIAALYEQGRVHHVGPLDELEDEMCSYSAAASEPSPNRMDALVWAVTELQIGATTTADQWTNADLSD